MFRGSPEQEKDNRYCKKILSCNENISLNILTAAGIAGSAYKRMLS